MQDPEAEPPLRDTATADLAHELGNRLAAIVAFSHLIRTDERLPVDLHDQADLLIDEANRTRDLVEQLLALTGRRVDPLASGTSDAAPGSPPTSPDGGAPRRVLVVDDEAAIRDFVARVLRRIGFEPLLAADGDEALEIIRSGRPPDAILCDHRMAGMSGPAFHGAVTEISPALAGRFAFMTGDVNDLELSGFAAARGIALIAKPFDMETVEQAVGRLVG